MFTSTDGTSWEQIGKTPEMTTHGGFAADPSGVYTVGTAPSTSGSELPIGGDLVVGRSTDGGRTWDTVPIPVELGGLAELPGIDRVGANAQLEAGPAGVIALVSLYASADLETLLPGVDASGGWTADETGLTVFGGEWGGCGPTTSYPTVLTVPPSASESSLGVAGGIASTTTSIEPDAATSTTAPAATEPEAVGPVTTVTACPQVSRQVTWTELGLGDDARQLLESPPSLVFRSTDGGSTFEQVATLTGRRQFGHLGTLAATPTGYAIAGTTWDGNGTSGSGFLMTSTDGVTWSDSPTPFVGTPLVDPITGGWFAVSEGFGEPSALYRSADGIGWTSMPLDAIVPALGEQESLSVWAQPTESGIAVVVLTGDRQEVATPAITAPSDPVRMELTVLYTGDGVNWSIEQPPLPAGSADSGFSLAAAGSQVVLDTYQWVDEEHTERRRLVGTPIG